MIKKPTESQTDFALKKTDPDYFPEIYSLIKNPTKRQKNFVLKNYNLSDFYNYIKNLKINNNDQINNIKISFHYLKLFYIVIYPGYDEARERNHPQYTSPQECFAEISIKEEKIKFFCSFFSKKIRVDLYSKIKDSISKLPEKNW